MVRAPWKHCAESFGFKRALGHARKDIETRVSIHQNFYQHDLSATIGTQPNVSIHFSFFQRSESLRSYNGMGGTGVTGCCKTVHCACVFSRNDNSGRSLQHWPMTFGNNGLQCSLSSHRFWVWKATLRTFGFIGKKLCHTLVGLHWVVAADHELRRWNIFVATRTCFLNTWHDRGLHSWVSLAKSIYLFIRDIVSDQSSSCCCSPYPADTQCYIKFCQRFKRHGYDISSKQTNDQGSHSFECMSENNIFILGIGNIKKTEPNLRGITLIKSFPKCNPENAWAANVSQFPTWWYIPCVCDDFFYNPDRDT